MKRSGLLHAIMMAYRNIRSYKMLSVTIVLSFALLLGYMGFTDASLYNRYKGIFARDKNIISINYGANPKRAEVFLEKLQEYGSVYYTHDLICYPIINHDQKYQLGNGNEIYFPSSIVHCLSGPTVNDFVDITWLDGKERTGITVRQGEAIIDDNMYYALGLDQEKNPVVEFRFTCNESGGGLSKKLKLQVVGIFQSDLYKMMLNDHGIIDETRYAFEMYVSTADLSPADGPGMYWTDWIYIYTSAPEEALQFSRQMYGHTNGNPTAEDQRNALEEIRTEKGTKALIAAAMLLILGINLYSSFSNALNDRKFEIGVKRAIGAKKGAIVRQFLYESIIVMLVDIILSVWLVALLGLAYKVIYEHTPDQYGYYHDFILYISPHSVAMFAVCTITLTLVFSLIFAYKSTQVQVVDYLKAE